VTVYASLAFLLCTTTTPTYHLQPISHPANLHKNCLATLWQVLLLSFLLPEHSLDDGPGLCINPRFPYLIAVRPVNLVL